MILVICGPTAVGKTKLSIELAKKYNAIILNADATQIYDEVNIGSAKVTEVEMEGIKHFLLSIKRIDEEYSIFDYQKDGRKILEENKDKNIIIVGGSGLYISALLYDYNFNERKNIDLSGYSNEELFQMVKNINEEADININNRVRLENYVKSGVVVTQKPKLLYDSIFVGLTTERENLYNKINNRVDKMIADGLIDEVKKLYEKCKDSKILHSAIGYKEIIKYLDGEMSLVDAVDLIKKNSRHYAKRQYTWFNNKIDLKWFNTDYENFNNTIKEVIDYIEKNS